MNNEVNNYNQVNNNNYNPMNNNNYNPVNNNYGAMPPQGTTTPTPKSKKGLFIALGVLLVVIVVVAVLLIVKPFQKEESKESNSNSNSNVATQPAKKVDESKDWIYDATYDYDRSYSGNYTRKRYDILMELGDYLIKNPNTGNYYDDVKVPYINMDSEDAKNVNSQMEKIYEKAMKSIDEGIADCDPMVDDYYGCTDVNDAASYLVGYQVLQSEKTNTISLIVSEKYSFSTSVSYPTLYIYVFDLDTGKVLNIEGLAKKYQMDVTTLQQKSEEVLKSILKAEIAKNDYLEYSEEDTLETYRTSFKNYAYENGGVVEEDAEFLSNPVHYFIDESGKLMLIGTMVGESVIPYPTVSEVK